jgi:predicted P-loop ATPase
MWAEAVYRYRQGETWWLDAEVEREQVAQVAQRFEDDVWASRIREFLKTIDDVSVAEILERCIFKPKERWARMDQMRIARTLQAEGWERRQKRLGNGEREWRYYRKGARIMPFPGIAIPPGIDRK